jgi:hypothetical protein
MSAHDVIEAVLATMVMGACGWALWDFRRLNKSRREYEAICEATLEGRIEDAARLSRAYVARWGGRSWPPKR